uniref:Uncharacterized protein n=1 Tax=viral metagenome TaxID=1070528 RepID=A0A6H1ZCH1_9ZZZZ
MFKVFDIEFGHEFRYFKGSSGGGGGAGVVDYPAYMKTWHGEALDNSGVDTFTTSLTAVMDAALGNSPWIGQVPYDPDVDLTAMIGSVGTLQTLVTLLSTGTTLDTLISDILNPIRIDDVVTEYAADLDVRLLAEVLPRFERGMQDINAVVSSAFVIGRALIEENQDRQVAKFSADLHHKAASDDALKVIALKLEYQRIASQTLAEIYRIKIVAKKEENESLMKIDESDAKWDLEVFAYGGNLLASIGGGTVGPTGSKEPSTAQSVIGGAMSGAVAGAMIAGASEGAIAGPWGMAAGAVLGAASGLL